MQILILDYSTAAMQSTLSMIKNVFIEKIYEKVTVPSSVNTVPERSYGIASSSQQRIWFESLKSLAVHNVILPLLVKHGSMSIEGIRSAIVDVVERQKIFRTAIRFNEQSNQLEQEVQPVVDKNSYAFQLTSTVRSPTEINTLLTAESNNNFAQIDRGLVLRCHLIKMSTDDAEHLHTDDLIVFTIHPIAFDVSSITPFLNAFAQAYDQSTSDLDSTQYLDFALSEHTQLVDPDQDSKMNQARHFWSTLMQGYDGNRNYSFPLATPTNTNTHSTRAHSIVLTLDSALVDVQIQWASSNNLSMFEVGLACYFLFLYKLSNGETLDFSITIPTNNRPLVKMNSVIGTFINLVPFRIKIEPNESFTDMVQRIHFLYLDVLEQVHLPYQEIVSSENNGSLARNVPFHYECQPHMSSLPYATTVEAETTDATLSLSTTAPHRLLNSATILHDLSLTITHDHLAQSTHCILTCSADKYEEMTLSIITQRFKHLLTQLFLSNTTTSRLDQTLQPIIQLSFLLPEKTDDRQQTTFHRLSNIVDTAPASYAQTRIWHTEQERFNAEKSPVANHNMPFMYRLSTNATLSISQLRQALDIVVKKHQCLRTALFFDTKENILMQRTIESSDENEKLFGFVKSTFETDEELNEIIRDEQINHNHFNLSQGLVFRCHLVRHKHSSSSDLLCKGDMIIFNFHHALVDIPSVKIFHHDLNQAYTKGQLAQDNDDIEALRYIDYAVVEKQMPMTVASVFWLDALRDCELDRSLSLSLSFDRHHLSDKPRSGRGISTSFDFGHDLSHAFLTYASTNNTSAKHLALASYYAFLFKLTNGEQNLCVAMNTDTRYKTELQSMIGMFVNTLPLSCHIDPSSSFARLVDDVYVMAEHSFKYSYFPLQRILAQHPHASKTTFQDIFFDFQAISAAKNHEHLTLSNVSLKPVSHSIVVVSNVDFSLHVRHDLFTDQLSCTINASLDFFDAETVKKIGQRYLLLLKQLFQSTLQRTTQPLYELSLLLPDEALLLQTVNDTQVSFPPPGCIHHQFISTALDQSQKVAIELDEQSLSYNEFLYYTQLVAIHLLDKYHIQPDAMICQCVERSISMVLGIMSIEMVGCSFCPLSPQDPIQRLHALVQQTQSPLVLVHSMTREKFADQHVVCDIEEAFNTYATVNDDTLHRLSTVAVTPENIAYVIFTSGSTGIPKAVQIRHKSFTACMHSLVHVKVFLGTDTVLQMAGCSYDVHVQEILGTLLYGATLVMLRPGGNMDLEYVLKLIEKKQITYMQSVPAYLTMMIDFFIKHNLPSLTRLRSMDIGGERVPGPMIDRLFRYIVDDACVWNLYGPAETTIDSTYYLVERHSDKTTIPIGRPLPNYQCLVLDEFLQPVIIGYEGELLVGGVGVFAGYLGHDDWTAKALVDINGEKFYRTGDLVRLDSRGLIHYVARKDHQVKLRGQRIELGEIERCLLDTSISACVVVKFGDDHLVAYVQSSDINVEQLRDHCRSRLAPFMIPSMFIVMEQLPLNANGKVDRKRLPTPDLSILSSTGNNDQHREPSNELETRLHSLWCDILKCNRVSTNTNIFSIGGHSLLLIQLFQAYKMTFDFDTRLVGIAEIFQHPTIADHARLIAQAPNKHQSTSPTSSLVLSTTQASTSSSKKRIAIDQHEPNNIITALDDLLSRYEPFPTTEIQQAYLFGRGGYLDLGHVACFTYQEYDCPSNFDLQRFEKAFNHLIQRHETLRIIFPSEMEQQILEKVPYYAVAIVDLNEEISIEEQLLERRMQLSHQVRPADQWPLFDIQLTRVLVDNQLQFRLHLGFDILILDLWSLNLVFHELNQLYFHANTSLQPLNLSYRDYIIRADKMKSTLVYETDKQYWIDRLSSFPTGPTLPLSCLPNELDEQHFIVSRRIIDRTLWQTLKQRIANVHLSPAGFLTSIYAIVLAKWSEEKHFSLNLPIFNRLPIHAQINQIAGDFTSIIPLEINLTDTMPFDTFVRIVQKQLWNDLEHMSYNGVSFIRELMRSKNTRQILLPSVFTCGVDTNDSSHGHSGTKNKLFTTIPVYGVTQTPQIYIDSQVHEHNGQLLIEWNHVEHLFPSHMIDDILQTFTDLLHRFTLSDEVWQQPVSVFLSVEQQQRRLLFNETQRKPDCKGNLLLHTLVIEQAQRTPDAWAIFSSRANLTYKQLMNRVYPLARHLQQQGVQSNQLIGIIMKKGWEQMVACLAILLSGGAYLPLDIDSPHDRLCALIKDADVKIILTQSHYQATFPQLTIIPVDTFILDMDSQPFVIDKQQSPTDLAYVIYTSGSTGKPKGVMINHQAVVNTILDVNSRLEVSCKDRIFALSHLNFDLSVYDIFGMLSVGGAIVIPDHEHYKNPQHWYDMMTQHHVTLWNSVPMLMQMLVEHCHDNSYVNNQLRHILLSGDWIPLSLPKSIRTTFGKQVTVTSLGGATEASIWSIAFCIPEEISTDWKSIPYGMPMRNQQYYVYDAHLNDCPEWVIGELYIGGIGLANGYWKDQQKTQSNFITHPRTGARLYRTGDHGRFLPNGYIEFIGRTDFQVKLNGYRIELGEIEYHLQRHPHVHQALVTVDEQYRRLIAYVTPKKEAAATSDFDWTSALQEYLTAKLPPHFIPSLFIVLEKFSLNANGKIDRKLLPAPDYSTFSCTDDADLESMTPLERHLQRIFAQALHVDSPKITLSLGQLGGTSLDAMRILALIRQEITTKVDIGVLLLNPSVRQLARVVEPLLTVQETPVTLTSSPSSEDNQNRPMPSMIIEALGILLLVSQWLYPLWKASQSQSPFALPLVPLCHLLSYVVFRYFLFGHDTMLEKSDVLYSWRYYRWWFLNRLWSINNSYWLRYLLGTPFYNSYLRLCGAKIGRDVHIYTTWIDAPWLLRVNNATLISSETILSNLSFYDYTYELHEITIGSSCSIETRSILYGTVNIQDYVHVKPMSTVTGNVAAQVNHSFIKERSFSCHQMIFQVTCLLCLLSIHIVLLGLTYVIYQRYLSMWLPFFICLALSWLFWTVTSLCTVMVLLKFVVRQTTPGVYPINSYYYLHKLWLRQLIISSFYHAFEMMLLFNALSPFLVRWLGAHIDEDVKLGELRELLHFPSDLLKLQRGVITFSAVMLAPYEITLDGGCCVDEIRLASSTNLGNGCTIMPGTQLESDSMIGTLTLITRNTRSSGAGAVLLGIPGRRMPFATLDNTATAKDQSSSSESSFVAELLWTCSLFFISKSLFFSFYCFLPAPIAPLMQTTFFYAIHRYSNLHQRTSGTFAYAEIITSAQQLYDTIMADFTVFVGPFLSRTQFLVFIFRTLGAKIGRDVILSDITCLTDPQLVTIGDHVRLNMGASIQCHTFEQRVFKVAPAIIHHSSVLMSGSTVLPGSTLAGRNRLPPLTLVMKNDHLPYNTVWSGVPARQI